MFCLGVFAASCGKQMQVTLPPPAPARVGAVEVGMASWYGRPYHGRTTSNGETYDMNKLTAAHLTLPFDTMVRVTNVSNGRSVDLRINDRGPFLKNRVIDVSRAAARRLDMIAAGTAEVRVEVIAAPGAQPQPAQTPALAETPAAVASCGESTRAVQTGAFRDPDNAARALAGLSSRFPDARILATDKPSGRLHRVVVPVPDAAAAQRTLEQLEEDGVDGFVTRISSPAACLAADVS